MNVDLYTDAGIKRGRGTWATVAVVPGQEPIEASGRLRAGLKCTATAELRAIANALHRMLRRGVIGSGDVVHVRTDNLQAVERIAGRSTKRPESTMAHATKVIHAFAEVHGIKVRASWVPGHKPNGHSPHARWNNRCDLLCRIARGVKPPPAPKPAPLSKARSALDVARRLSGAGS